MSKELTAEFAAKPDGVVNFLRRYAMIVNPQYFAPQAADVKDNPMTGAKFVDRRMILKELVRPGAKPDKDQVIQDKPVPFWCEFDYFNTAQAKEDALTPGVPRPATAAKSLVVPVLHQTNVGGHCVKMYYLPWREDKKHVMTLMDDADYFMTASMHGCRFQAEDLGRGWVRVSHTNIQPSKEYDAQARCKRLADSGRRVGVLTVDYGKDRYIQEVEREFARVRHHALTYGIPPEDVQSFDAGTYQVNVFGIRRTGRWEFYYQIAGKMIADLTGHTTKRKHLKLFGMKTKIPTGWKQKEVKHSIELDVVVKVGKL